MSKGIPIVLNKGERYRKLTIVELSHSSVYGNHYKCKCDCGNDVVLSGSQIKYRIGSCGCRSKPIKTTELYKLMRSVWKGMMRRCYNKNHVSYHRYGGRGICVEERWRKFKNFFDDMSESYIKGLQLDRENNDEWYTKINCRWVTRIINMRNRVDVKLTESDVIKIRESDKTTIELGKIYNIDPSGISRIKNNKIWI